MLLVKYKKLREKTSHFHEKVRFLKETLAFWRYFKTLNIFKNFWTFWAHIKRQLLVAWPYQNSNFYFFHAN